MARWAASLALIGWFVVLTRAEPSVLRAGVMAGLAATAFALGREREPPRLLALAVVGLLLVDPLLVWSVGFWLSVGRDRRRRARRRALARRLCRLGPLALPVAVTLGAQWASPCRACWCSAACRSWHRGQPPRRAGRRAGDAVRPAGVPGGRRRAAVGALVMVPVGWGVRWVDAVATVAAAVEPAPPWSWLGWVGLVVAVVALVGAARRRLSATEGRQLPRRDNDRHRTRRRVRHHGRGRQRAGSPATAPPPLAGSRTRPP